MVAHIGCAGSIIKLVKLNIVQKDSKVHFESFFYTFLKSKLNNNFNFHSKKFKKIALICVNKPNNNAIRPKRVRALGCI